MKVRSFEQVSDLLSAAHKYQVLKLVDKCFDSLFKCITPDNAFSALNYAIRYSYIRMKVSKKLINKMIDFKVSKSVFVMCRK